jgi:hypothetical protein
MTGLKERRQAIDPETRDLLESLRERDDVRSMSAKERKERKRTKTRLKHRVNWDLPLALKEEIKTIAEQEGVPESQLAALLLSRGIEALQTEGPSIHEVLLVYKVPSSSPRFEWNLSIESTEGEKS